MIRTALMLACVLVAMNADAQPAPPAPAVQRPIEIVPATLKLIHHRQPHSLLVRGKSADGIALDLTSQTMFQSSDPNIATVDGQGWVTPVISGSAKITATVAGQSIEVPVTVEVTPTAEPYSFRHEIMPILSKGGCNMGACHGYSLGKGGLSLSLRGANALQDYESIFGDAQGRRLNLLNPAESLVIRKPSGEVPHRGGTRFPKNSPLRDVLLKWVESGAPSDFQDQSEVESVSISPERFVLEPGMKHQLQLIAHYTNGSTRDVTRLGIFNVNTEGVADVNDSGLVTAGDHGESAVVARFERKFAAARLIVLRRDAGFQPAAVPTDNFIDQHIGTKLNDLKITPSEIAGDEEFLRRLYIDLIGLQPTPEEVLKFAADTDPGKRLAVVDALLARPEYVDHWSLKWGDLFQNSRVRLSEQSVYAFREWIRSAVASNMPLDEMTRRLLTGRGGAADDPASAFYAISKDTNETLERVAQVFCGVRMLCARCHPHPMENWTQADYYGLNSFFNQVTVKADPRLPGVPNARFVMRQLSTGNATNPRTNAAQPPRYLGGGEPALAADTDRPVEFANWLTSKDNPHFGRSLANRFWSYFFSRGIIDPVDDLRTTNPPINPPLLDDLTRDFVEHGFDARHLIRRIVTARAYQRTSLPTESNRLDTLNFSHSIPRRVPAEALLDSIVQATGVRENFGGAPAGFSAAQLPDAEVTNDFLSLFGKPQRMEACECERDNESNMLQALHLINNSAFLRRMADPNGRVAQLLKNHEANDPLIEDIYLWSLARRPTAVEMQVAQKHFAAYAADRTGAAQDLMWALLNSKDMLLVR